MKNLPLSCLFLLFSLPCLIGQGGLGVFSGLASGFFYSQSEIMANDAHYNLSLYHLQSPVYSGGFIGAKSQTWERKYGMFPGSKTWGVAFTDSYHASRFLSRLTGIYTIGSGVKPGQLLLSAAVRFVAFSAGFHAGYLITCPNCSAL